MGNAKAAHHRGEYDTKSRRMNAAAYADPTAICWRDGLTLAQHPPGSRWSCGHVDDVHLFRRHAPRHADLIDGNLCAPEINRCNSSHGAHLGNNRRHGLEPTRPR